LTSRNFRVPNCSKNSFRKKRKKHSPRKNRKYLPRGQNFKKFNFKTKNHMDSKSSAHNYLQ